VCGCGERTPCAGGCFWLEDDLCSSCANVHVGPGASTSLLEEPVDIALAAGTALALHGSLCLALGSTELRRRLPSAVLEQFVDDLGELLVELEVITPEIREGARRGVIDAAPRIVLARG
jgi:hypothetical protein